jgi:excisionase family DNA binding protein
MTRSETTERLLTIAQAAARFGVHQNTLRSWTDAGRVPHVLLPSGYRRYRPADIDRMVQQMSRGAHETADQDDPGGGS